MKPTIFLSVPILDRPELKMISSLYQAMLTCKDYKIRVYYNESDSLISRARNSHISVFLDEFKECDYFMSIDSDIEIINAYSTNNIFSKLAAHNVDFVGGLYPLKREGRVCSSITADYKNTNLPFDSGLIEMRWLSSGCWCLKRSAVEKMVAAYPELAYDGDDNMSNKKVYGLYIPMIEHIEHGNISFDKYLSEDWSFCNRWKKIGGKIYADTSVVLKHIGKKQYALWDVEVVAKRKSDIEAEKLIEANEGTPGPDLPPAGFDLEK